MQNFLVTDKTNDFNSLWSLAKIIENNNNEQEEMSLNKISEVPTKSFCKETHSINSKIKQNFNNRLLLIFALKLLKKSKFHFPLININ